MFLKSQTMCVLLIRHILNTRQSHNMEIIRNFFFDQKSYQTHIKHISNTGTMENKLFSKFIGLLADVFWKPILSHSKVIQWFFEKSYKSRATGVSPQQNVCESHPKVVLFCGFPQKTHIRHMLWKMNYFPGVNRMSSQLGTILWKPGFKLIDMDHSIRNKAILLSRTRSSISLTTLYVAFVVLTSMETRFYLV